LCSVKKTARVAGSVLSALTLAALGVAPADAAPGALRALDADVIGLEEVDVHGGERSEYADEARELAAKLGMRVFFAPIYDVDPHPNSLHCGQSCATPRRAVAPPTRPAPR
jgi:hypothetical protein